METAKNGFDLFQKVQKHKNTMTIDLILLDLHMPIMNGFEACQNICKLYESLILPIRKPSSNKIDKSKMENLKTGHGLEKQIYQNVERKMKNIQPLIVASTGLLSEKVIQQA